MSVADDMAVAVTNCRRDSLRDIVPSMVEQFAVFFRVHHRRCAEKRARKVAVGDPVGLGLVQSLARPGGNITGLATYMPGNFVAKQIEILQELVPGASKIVVLVNPSNPMHKRSAEELPQAAQKLAVALPIVEATTAEELDIALASAAAQHADAIIVFGDPLHFRYPTQIAALAAKHRLPAIYLFRLFATNGGLISAAIAQLDQRTALPDQCPHSAEADVRPPRKKSGFGPISDLANDLLRRVVAADFAWPRSSRRARPIFPKTPVKQWCA